jgi:hypothetical protein
MLRPDAPALPWIVEIRSRVHAPPSPPPARVPPAIAETSLTLAQRDGSAVPEANPPEDGTADESEPGIGEPIEVEKYLEATDRAAAHSARSR